MILMTGVRRTSRYSLECTYIHYVPERLGLFSHLNNVESKHFPEIIWRETVIFTIDSPLE